MTRTKEGRFKPLPKGPTGAVQLLLIQSVDHLGKQGDVVHVKRGYAFNYLLPQGLATVATDHHKRMVEKHRSKLLEIEKSRLAGLRVVASYLDSPEDPKEMPRAVEVAEARKRRETGRDLRSWISQSCPAWLRCGA